MGKPALGAQTLALPAIAALEPLYSSVVLHNPTSTSPSADYDCATKTLSE
jgi:hypothetical protein